MQNKKGFTLIESVVTVGILVSAVIVLAVFVGAVALRKVAEVNLIASRIATGGIETLKNTPFAELQPSGTINNPELVKLKNASATYTVADFGGNPEIKQADVIVSWDYKGAVKTIKNTTLLTDGGL